MLTRLFSSIKTSIKPRLTVDAVVEDFNRQVRDLKTIAAARKADAASCEERINNLVRERESATHEAIRAVNVAGKIKALMS